MSTEQLSSVFILLLAFYLWLRLMRFREEQIRRTEREMRAYAQLPGWSSPQHLRPVTPLLRWARGRHRKRTVIKVVPRP